MAVLKAPNSSNLATFRAAEWAVQINIGTDSAPNWTFVNGISRFDPTNTPTMQDDTDINSEAYASQIATMQALNITMEGKFKGLRNESTGVVELDPGVQKLRDLGKEVGYNNIAHLRYWRTDDIPEAFEHRFGVEWRDQGGTLEQLQQFTATLSGRGKPTEIAKPQAAPITKVFTIHDSPTGGDFTISVDGFTTTPIVYDGTSTPVAADVQSAMEALDSVGAGNVTVTGADFVGPFSAEIAVPVTSVTADGSNLTPEGYVSVQDA